MAMEETRLVDQLNGLGLSQVGTRSLRKKKSLKQLFIPSKQKSFRSEPFSAPDTRLGVLSPLDSPLFRGNGKSIRNGPPKTFSVMFNERLPGREIDYNVLHSRDPLLGTQHPVAEEEDPSRAITSAVPTVISASTDGQSMSSGQQASASTDPPWTGSPSLPPDGTTPEVSPKTIQRSFTEGSTQVTTKPAHVKPRFSFISQKLPSPQTPPYAYAPRSPDANVSQRGSKTSTSHEDSSKESRSPLPAQCQRVPWNPIFDVRESISSYSPSKHSSVFTKDTAVTDTTIDAEHGDNPKHSLTVDECIDMYIAGFADDEVPDIQDVKDRDVMEEINRRSAQIAEAMDDSIGVETESPRIEAFPTPPVTSPGTVPGRSMRSRFHRQPSLRVVTATHDIYGFKKSTRDVTIEAYDAWYSHYSETRERRIEKWASLMRTQGLTTRNPIRFPAHSAKIQRFIRKGIPPAWRGEAWFFYAGGDKFLAARPDHYSELVLKSQTCALFAKDKEAIERDLHRTFPENIHFKAPVESTVQDGQLPSPTETPMLSALRRLLSAFAIDHPNIGYCQSLNFIAGLLLLFLSEEKAFWMLHIITMSLLPGSHEESLEGTDVDTWVLMLALRDQNPSLWAKVGGDVQSNTRYLPDISMCTTSWFMSAFIGNLPIECVLRVWDIWFYEGSKTLFRIALAIFRAGEEEIKKIQDPVETLQVIQTLPRKMLDVAHLFEIAFSRGEVGKRWIEKKRQERKEYHIKRRAAERQRRESADYVRKDSDTKSFKGLPSPSPSMIEEEEAMPSLQSSSTRSKYKHWLAKSHTRLDAM